MRKVDPTDFLALRSELVDMRARLEASEQAKAIVEARLAALDATTTAIASNRLGGEDIRAKVSEIEGQLHGVAATAAAAAATAESASMRAATAASTIATPHHSNADPILAARVEALIARVDAIPPAAAPDPELAARVEALAQQVQVGSAPDPSLAARLDQMAQKMEAVTVIGAQLSQLNDSVAAQAAVGTELADLRARLDELAVGDDVRRQAAVVATEDAALRDQVNSLGDRMANTDALAAQIAQLAERIAANDSATRHATEQVSTLEQRLSAVSTELANQVSELGNDIDGLAAHQTDVAQGTVSDEVIEALRSAQVKLAAEQARYEIAFRQDLAALAEQVRRGPKG